jgi:4-deoxy-L-threo-5-hexosulose-uronate ketol-isomerase
MEIRQPIHSEHAKHLDTSGLRRHFLIEEMFQQNKINLIYSHIDRIIVGAAVPLGEPLSLEGGKEIGVEFFLQRRELGVINIGEPGLVTVDGKTFEIGAREALYVGMGAREIVFFSVKPEHPARFYLNCAPAHHAYPTRPFQALRHFDEAPELPSGYATMLIPALIPSLWFKMMDKRVYDHYEGDLTKANISQKRRAKIFKKFGLSA